MRTSNQLDWHWGEQWTWQWTEDIGGRSLVPIAAKWLASGTDDDHDRITQTMYCNAMQ